MRNLLKSGRNSGVSLVELLAAVAATVVVVVGVSVMVPRVGASIVEMRVRQGAVVLGQSGLEELKSVPYHMLDATPDGDYFTTGNCDCEKADFERFRQDPPHTQYVRKTNSSYRIQTCVNYLGRSDSTLYPVCPSAATVNDPGRKGILMRVSWFTNHSTKTITMQSLTGYETTARYMVQSATYTINLTYRSTNNTTIDGHPDLNGALVTIFNDHYSAVKTYPGSGPLHFAIPPGSDYKVHVHSEKFYPGRLAQGLTFAAGDAGKEATIALTPRSLFSTQYAGEVFIATYPVITKVVPSITETSGFSICDEVPQTDLSEMIEIYNPLATEVTFGGPSGDLQLGVAGGKFAGASWLYQTVDFTNPGFKQWDGGALTLPIRIPPYGHMLIEGRYNTSSVIPPTPKFGPVVEESKPDILYLASTENDLVRSPTIGGGALRLIYKGTKTDAVRWEGGATNPQPPNNNPENGGPWPGPFPGYFIPKSWMMPLVYNVYNSTKVADLKCYYNPTYNYWYLQGNYLGDGWPSYVEVNDPTSSGYTPGANFDYALPPLTEAYDGKVYIAGYEVGYRPYYLLTVVSYGGMPVAPENRTIRYVLYVSCPEPPASSSSLPPSSSSSSSSEETYSNPCDPDDDGYCNTCNCPTNCTLVGCPGTGLPGSQAPDTACGGCMTLVNGLCQSTCQAGERCVNNACVSLCSAQACMQLQADNTCRSTCSSTQYCDAGTCRSFNSSSVSSVRCGPCQTYYPGVGCQSACSGMYCTRCNTSTNSCESTCPANQYCFEGSCVSSSMSSMSISSDGTGGFIGDDCDCPPGTAFDSASGSCIEGINSCSALY